MRKWRRIEESPVGSTSSIIKDPKTAILLGSILLVASQLISFRLIYSHRRVYRLDREFRVDMRGGEAEEITVDLQVAEVTTLSYNASFQAEKPFNVSIGILGPGPRLPYFDSYYILGENNTVSNSHVIDEEVSSIVVILSGREDLNVSGSLHVSYMISPILNLILGAVAAVMGIAGIALMAQGVHRYLILDRIREKEEEAPS